MDAAAIDSQVLTIELRDHPELGAGLRVVGSFGPSTTQPVVAASRLPDRLRDQVRELLVELADDPAARPALDHGLVVRFTRSTTAPTTTSGPCRPPSRPPAGPASPRRRPAAAADHEGDQPPGRHRIRS